MQPHERIKEKEMDGTYSRHEQNSFRKSGGMTPLLEDLGEKSKIILK